MAALYDDDDLYLSDEFEEDPLKERLRVSHVR